MAILGARALFHLQCRVKDLEFGVSGALHTIDSSALGFGSRA